ncbi:MAG: metallophosphoesterase, partial [Hyphomicrobiales bacterium]
MRNHSTVVILEVLARFWNCRLWFSLFETSSPVAFKLAHISDLHLEPPASPSFRELLSKRLIGHTNWRNHRRNQHHPATLNKLVRDLKDQSPDHTAITGDLINLALPAEFDNAANWLNRFGSPTGVSVVPGNHDAYVPGSCERAVRGWGKYGTGHRVNGAAFPFIRHKQNVALIGC